MNVDIVVDVGNSRIKWGRCAAGSIAASASLPPDDPTAWQQQLDAWQIAGPLSWLVSGVQPQRRDRLIELHFGQWFIFCKSSIAFFQWQG